MAMGAWYDHAIIYQIYPKSFQDSNGDGIGDLNGIRQRIPYLTQLGINAVWLNPVFTSPQVDNGYDVANYYAIDPAMGTMADMDDLIQALHEAGIHVILDFVLNHTSDQHPWFQDALRGPASLYRDYYIFAGSHNQRPNNWGSFFGGSVWEPDPSGSGQSYFHLFDKHMPDLNWANPEVRHAMGDVANYWLQKGIDGLRVDAFIHIAKAALDQDLPTPTGTSAPVTAEPFYANLPQVQSWLRPFCAQLKADYPNVFLLGEAASANVNLAVDYTAPDRGLMDSVVTFRYFTDSKAGLDPNLPEQYQTHQLDFAAFKQTQAVWQQTLAGVSQPTLYWGNHDMPRVNGRVAHTPTQAQSLAMLMYLQRGIPIIYYGEELGMQNLTLPTVEAFHDPSVTAFVQAAVAHGISEADALEMVSANHKLPARGPMQWTAAGGFTNGTPWLTGQAEPLASAAEQAKTPGSTLVFYQHLLALKRQSLFQTGDYRLLTTDAASYVYQRRLGDQVAIVAVALGETETTITLPAGRYHVRLQTGDATLTGHTLTLGAYAGVVLS